jgi:hypothetical protein
VIAAWDKLARPVGGKVFGQDALLIETRSDDGPTRNFATTLGYQCISNFGVTTGFHTFLLGCSLLFPGKKPQFLLQKPVKD